MEKGSASSEAELPIKAQRRRGHGGANSSSSAGSDGRDYTPFKRWVAWLVPCFTAVNVMIFVITMYVNDCPKNTGSACIARFLGRFSFQPMKENPLLGPSSTTWVPLFRHIRARIYYLKNQVKDEEQDTSFEQDTMWILLFKLKKDDAWLAWYG